MTLLYWIKSPLIPVFENGSIRFSHHFARKKNSFVSPRSVGVGLVSLTLSVGTFLWKQNKGKLSVLCEANPEDLESSPAYQTAGIPVYVQPHSLEEAIVKSTQLILRFKEQYGTPGLVVGVSANGRDVWEKGFGYSDLENHVRCSSGTIMRIASISKSITMAVVAKLWENGELDLDKPIQDYVPTFPKKTLNGEEVVITSRHLVSHLSGIRHYKKSPETPDKANAKDSSENKINDENNNNQSDFVNTPEEYFLNKRFKTVSEALTLFQDDLLFHKPGEKYLYTTNGWTLLSAVVEKIVGEPFPIHMTEKFKEFGMTQTSLDMSELIVYNRARYYQKNKSGTIVNVPQVDNSYKWAGGGFQSTVKDLLRFGRIMLYSSQHNEASPGLPGYLKSSTVAAMWTPVERTKKRPDDTRGYGMGWLVCPRVEQYGECQVRPMVAVHSGKAIGASSVLLLIPGRAEPGQTRGLVVAILTNLESIVLEKLALDIAHLFEKVNFDIKPAVGMYRVPEIPGLPGQFLPVPSVPGHFHPGPGLPGQFCDNPESKQHV